MQRNVVIDERLPSYRSFFDHEWARRMNKLVDGTPLDPLVFDLTLSWKGIGVNNQFPRLMVEVTNNAWKGMAASQPQMTATLVQAVGTRLAKELADELNPQQLERLSGIVAQIAEMARTQMPELLTGYESQELWDRFRADKEFALAVWNAQRLIFGGLYYGYEHFLLRAYETATGREGYRIYTKTFGKDLADTFGEDVRERCWADQEVNVARLIRHVLAHNGGRETPELKATGHSIRVEAGDLHIMPPHSAALFAVLKQRVEFFVNKTVGTIFRRAA